MDREKIIRDSNPSISTIDLSKVYYNISPPRVVIESKDVDKLEEEVWFIPGKEKREDMRKISEEIHKKYSERQKDLAVLFYNIMRSECVALQEEYNQDQVKY